VSVNESKLNEFLGKAVGDLGAAMSSTLMLVGDRLGLYKEIGKGPAHCRGAGKKNRHQRALHPRVASVTKAPGVCHL